MTSIAVQLAVWLLKLPLNIQQRTKLIGAILRRLEAVPLTEIIKMEGGRLTIDGKPVDYEKATKIKAGAEAMLSNPTRELVREQVAVVAGTRGVVKGDTPEKLYFYRAALWAMLTEEELYKQLSGSQQQLSTPEDLE